MSKKMPMRLRVLLTILPIAIIPIIVVAIVTVELIRDRMLSQSKVFYSNIISQVQSNIDFFYSQYAIVLSEVTQTDSFQMIVNHPEAKSFADQRLDIERIDRLSVYGRVRANIIAKSKGDFILLETDRFDYGRNVDFLMTKFSVNDIVLTDKNKVFNSPVYKVMKENMNMQPILTAASFLGLDGYELDMRSAFFSPYINEGDSDITKIFGIVESKDFLRDLYVKITSLQTGTIYILDQFNNILSVNHPNFDDFYEYNKKTGKYVFNVGDSLSDPFSKMSFREFNLLNTDKNILNNLNIDQLSQEESDDNEMVYSKITKFKNIDYLTFVTVSPLSKVKIVYFKPVKQILGPIVQMINVVLIIVLIVTLLVVILSLFISKFFTRPIVNLTDAARTIKSGDYSVTVDAKKYFGEFVELGDTFNSMISRIDEYNKDLEGLVTKRTEELNVANAHLQNANHELTLINEKNRRDLSMAQRIQLSLIPKIFPHSEILEFSALYLPMEALGGDLYDVYKLSDSQFGILILDVCGHGVPAALITTMAKMSFSTNTKLYSEPNKVLDAVNKDICEAIQGSGDFLTAFYGIIDIEKMTLEYSNGGHNDMIVVSEEGLITTLGTNGPIIGVFEDMIFGFSNINLNKKDRIVLYTDGVTEAMNKDKDLYMSDRLIDLIKKNINKSSKEFTRLLFDDIMVFKAGVQHNDDIAVVVADVVF